MQFKVIGSDVLVDIDPETGANTGNDVYLLSGQKVEIDEINGGTTDLVKVTIEEKVLHVRRIVFEAYRGNILRPV